MSCKLEVSFTSSEDDSEIEELCKLAKIKYEKTAQRRKVTTQPTLTPVPVPEHNSMHTKNYKAVNTSELLVHQPKNSAQEMTDDNNRIINIADMPITGDYGLL